MLHARRLARLILPTYGSFEKCKLRDNQHLIVHLHEEIEKKACDRRRNGPGPRYLTSATFGRLNDRIMPGKQWLFFVLVIHCHCFGRFSCFASASDSRKQRGRHAPMTFHPLSGEVSGEADGLRVLTRARARSRNIFRRKRPSRNQGHKAINGDLAGQA